MNPIVRCLLNVAICYGAYFVLASIVCGILITKGIRDVNRPPKATATRNT